jgi:predicted dehydrogenase
VIGTGRMAAAMMSTFARINVNVVAVSSHDSNRQQKFAQAFNIPPSKDDLDSLLQRRDIDAVYIANNNTEHAATAIAALEGGKAVLCEKPIAVSAAECERVVHVARKTGNLCVEAIWTLFLPAYRRFVDLAQASACGKPDHLYCDFGYPVDRSTSPQLFAAQGGGVLLDRSVYLIALALRLFGPAETLHAQLDLTDEGVDHRASLMLKHKSGGHSQLSTSLTSLRSNIGVLACSNGTLQLGEPLVGSESISLRHKAPDLGRGYLGRRRRLTGGLRQNPLVRRLKRSLPNFHREYHSYGAHPYLPQLEHFLKLMEARAVESDIIPFELSMEIYRIIDWARAGNKVGVHEGRGS